MALPIEPETGMFPDTLQEPFVDAPQVRDLAEEVMAEFDEFREVREAVDREEISIAYVFETKAFDQLTEEFKPHTIAKVTKASPLWRSLTERELVIQFRRPFWDAFDHDQRRAVLHHELTHIELERTDNGRLKISLRAHDVEDFSSTMRPFGPVLPGRRGFVKAFQDWQHRQEQPEPTPLRPVEDIAEDVMAMSPVEQAAVIAAIDFRRAAEAAGVGIDVAELSERALDVAVDAINAGAMGPGVTASRPGRTRESHGFQVADRGCPDGDCALAEGHAGEHLPTKAGDE